MLKISVEHFEFELSLRERSQSLEAYEDWCRLSVQVAVPGFHGSFDWGATLGDLRRLDESFQLISDLGEKPIDFEPVEPSVRFRFSPTPTGVVRVDYHFQSRLGWGPSLRGSFEFDQSYVPKLRKDLNELLALATPA